MSLILRTDPGTSFELDAADISFWSCLTALGPMITLVREGTTSVGFRETLGDPWFDERTRTMHWIENGLAVKLDELAYVFATIPGLYGEPVPTLEFYSQDAGCHLRLVWVEGMTSQRAFDDLVGTYVLRTLKTSLVDGLRVADVCPCLERLRSPAPHVAPAESGGGPLQIILNAAMKSCTPVRVAVAGPTIRRSSPMRLLNIEQTNGWINAGSRSDLLHLDASQISHVSLSKERLDDETWVRFSALDARSLPIVEVSAQGHRHLEWIESCDRAHIFFEQMEE